MAFNTFLQNTGNPDFLDKCQQASRDFFTNQDNEQHLDPYSIQAQGNICPSIYSLPPGLKNGIGVPQNCHSNLSNMQMAVSMNYQPQPQYQPNGFNTSQLPVQTFLRPTHQFSQNLKLLRSSSSSHKVNPQTAPDGRLHTHSPHFTLPAHTNSYAVLPCESFPQTLQVPQGYSQQNKQIPSLHNQQSVAAIPMLCTASMQSNTKSLESANPLQQHKTPYHTSNADLIQSSQMNHPSFGNMHTMQAGINSFGHEFMFPSQNMSHLNNPSMGNQIRTSTNASSINQSNSTTYNHLYNMQGLNNPMSLYSGKPLTKYREILPTNQQYLDNSKILPSNSTSVSSAGILPIQNIHSRSMNPHPGSSQNKGINVIYPGNLNLTNVRPENINPTNIEGSNGHPTFLDSSITNHHMNEESSIKSSHPTGVPWNESGFKGSGGSFHWYKYPETQNDSPFISDVQAMQADSTDHTSTTAETCSRTQFAKSAVQIEPIPQVESQSRVNNFTPVDEIQDSLNSSREENDSRSNSSRAEAICQNFRSEALESVQIKQERADISNSTIVKLNETANDFGMNSSKDACIDSSSVAIDSSINKSSLQNDASISYALATNSSPNVINVSANALAADKENSNLRKNLTAIEAAACELLTCGQRNQPKSRVNPLLQTDVSIRLQALENDVNKIVTNSISSSQSAAAPTVKKENGSKTAKLVVETASNEIGKGSIISDKDVKDKSNVSKPLTLCQKVSLSNNSTIMIPSDKDTYISTNQQSISTSTQLDISARNQSPDVNRQRSFNIQSSRNSSDALNTADNVKGSTIDRMLQHSGSLVNTTKETQTSSSLVNKALETKTCSETPVTMTKKAANFKYTMRSVLHDTKLINGNNVTGVAAAIENRRKTSPNLSGRTLPDGRHEPQRFPVQRQLAPRLSLDTQKLSSQSILHRQNQAASVDDQNNLNHQKDCSGPRYAIAPTKTEKLQSGSCENKTMTAREKVFNSWKSLQIVGKISGAGRGKGGTTVSRIIKRTQNCTNSEVELKKRLTLREPSTAKDIPVRLTPAISLNSTRPEDVHETPHLAKMDKIKQACVLIYIMFHGHKLICLKSDTESQILLCQFLYECFPDTGLGSVNNCINRSLQINKMPLDHPEKERILMFLKKNGYQVENLVQTISVNDARKIYHHMFEITTCTNATCAIELPESTVDLDVFDSTSSRKTLTREIMSRMTKVEQFEEQSKDPEKSSNASTDTEHKVEIDGNARNNLSAELLNSQLPIIVPPLTLHPGSPGSDHTVAYGKGGEDYPNDVIHVIIEDLRLISWSPGTDKVGGLSNTCLGQLRFYRHNNETFLAVDDLCRVLGPAKFYHGVMDGNIILYSCCQEIANFLNSFSEPFPPLKSLHNSLVKASDIGVNSTVTAHCNSGQDGISLLKMSLCKMENLNEECTPSKQSRLDDTNIVKDEFELNEMNVIQKGKCNEFAFMDFKKFESDSDRVVSGMEMTDIMIQEPQNEVSAGECSLSSTVAKSPPNMSVQCQNKENSLRIIDSLTLQVSTSRGISNTLSTYDINTAIIVGSKDIALIRSDACSSPCSLKSLASSGEPFTPILSDVNNPASSPVSSSNKNSLKSLMPHTPAICDDSLDAKNMNNSLSMAANHHTTTQQPVEYTDHFRRPEQESASSGSKHLEISCNQGQNSFSSINTLPECFVESESKISCIDSKNNSLTYVHTPNNSNETSKYSLGSMLCTSSLINNEFAGGEASLPSTQDISLIDENLPHNQGDMTADTDNAVESTFDLNNDNSALAISDGFSMKGVLESIEENITAKAAGLVKSSLECEVAQQQRTRTQLSLLMLALSNDIESASTLPSTLHIVGNQRAIDDIDVMSCCSSTGMLVPPSCRKVFTKLCQQQRALLGAVDSLKKRLALSEAARDKSDQKKKYYEGVIHDMTSTFKNGDMESVDC